jgi:hypothetical protein
MRVWLQGWRFLYECDDTEAEEGGNSVDQFTLAELCDHLKTAGAELGECDFCTRYNRCFGDIQTVTGGVIVQGFELTEEHGLPATIVDNILARRGMADKLAPRRRRRQKK